MTEKVSKVVRVSKGLLPILLCVLFSCLNADRDAKKESLTLPAPSENFTQMTLFYPRQTGSDFAKTEVRVKDLKKSPSAWFQIMMDELSKAPNSEVRPIFPQKLQLYSLFSEKDVLYLDFPSQIQKSFFPTIHAEQIAFDAFLASIKANFPFAKQVKILVEHEDAEIIWGHIYAQQPFSL